MFQYIKQVMGITTSNWLHELGVLIHPIRLQAYDLHLHTHMECCIIHHIYPLQHLYIYIYIYEWSYSDIDQKKITMHILKLKN